jgi:hypothetical protein
MFFESKLCEEILILDGIPACVQMILVSYAIIWAGLIAFRIKLQNCMIKTFYAVFKERPARS